MELKELIKIIRCNIKLYALVVALFIVGGLFFQFLRPISYKADLALNITRQGKQETGEYKYDDFYRLQADERFADTIVRWLGSAKLTEEISRKADLVDNSESVKIKSRRLSSQFIQVSYSVTKVGDAKKIAEAITESLNSETNELNKLQKQDNWFTIIGSDPVIIKNEIPLFKILLMAVLAGLFFGFWIILFRHYLKEI